jgi:uncharacterized membrane protein YfcA
VHVTFAQYAVLFLTAIAGATVQGSVGFGLNLMVVPVAAIIVPEALPGAMILSTVPLTATMAARSWSAVDKPGATRILLARIPGAAIGVAIVAAVSASLLGVLAGSAVIIAVGLSLFSGPRRITPGEEYGAGLAAGVTGTAAALEGPPLALIYQHAPADVLRGTLAALFAAGSVMSFVALSIAGEMHGWQVLLSVALMPPIAVGYALSTPITKALHGRSLRPAVLTVAALAGVVAILRGLL